MSENEKLSSDNKGYGLALLNQIQNDTPVHQELVRRVEAITQRNLICYTAHFGHPAGTIVQPDGQLIELLLRSIDLSQYPDTLDLMLHTPGGDPTAAERIVMTCRNFSKSFRVIVARTCMSAGTLTAMGADSILMTETAELGPIDPQMITADPGGQGAVVRPAASFVDAYVDLIQKAQSAIKANEPPHPFLELLKRLDPTWIQVCLKARELARTLGHEFLKKYMHSKKTDQDIEKVIDRFMKEGELLSHGRIIRYEKAKEYGLDVNKVITGEPLDRALWELQMRCENYVQTRRFAKYLVGRAGGINVNVERAAL